MTDYDNRLRKKDWEVRAIPLALARQKTELYHYAKGGSNTRVYTHGLFQKNGDECFGITWWLPPTKSAALATYPKNWQGVLSLSRLVVTPGTPKNACTFLLAGSVALLDREKWPCLVTYADDWQGHVGTIYRASNWNYVGKTKPQRVYSINGRMTARKAGPKTRTHAEMVSLGAILLGTFAKHKYTHCA